ncbi:MAG: type II glyceraldehyde-3-phosphate dehydrogenase [archaeon]
MKEIQVGVVGYGTIGKRVADAVNAQEDMKLVGVADVKPGRLLSVALLRDYAVFAPKEVRRSMASHGIDIAGTVDDLLAQVDVVVDAAPKGITASNIPRYEEHGIKYIIEGGEKHSLAGRSFSTFGNYAENIGKDKTRVVSCNTTGLTRIYRAIDTAFGVEHIGVYLVRRGSDPVNGDKGPSNAVVPVLGESHHYHDLVTVIPGIAPGCSMAVADPHTLSHVHMLDLTLSREPTREDVYAALDGFPRIRTVDGEADGMGDTAKIAEFYQDIGRLRGDHPEVTAWKEGVIVEGKRMRMPYDVHMVSIPIPENVDAIRALAGNAGAWESAKMTDRALDKFLPMFSKPDLAYWGR